ncbi:MFS transporter [Micromonosporaceae bacterium DT194]|uniref:MFS transporter n=1 Tax=Melissospora conviva TaxID=3388432 RepID=UPI003C1D9DC6
MRRSALLTVCLAVFVDMLGFGIILPLLPFHTQDLGGTGIWVGALLTSYAAAQFVAAPVLGSLSDRFGRRPVLITALLGSAISLALTGVAGTLATLLLARVVAGAFGGAIAIGQAYVSDFTVGKARTQALGMIGASIGMGFVFGPAIGALLADLGFAGVSFVAAGVALANAILGYFLLPRTTPAAAGAPARRGGGNPLTALRHALGNATLRPLLLVIFAFTFAFVGMEATFALLGAERFGLDARALGLVFAGIGIMMAIVQGGLVGRLSGSFGNRKVAIAGALLLAAGLVILPFVSPWVGYPALGLLAVGQGLLTTTTSALIAEEGGAELGGAFGVSQSASALARALGPLAAGALYDVKIPLPYLLGAALALLAAALLVSRRRGGTAPATPAETGQPATAS